MSIMLDEPATQTLTSASNRLRETTAAMRLSFTWFGVRKTLSREQKARAAESFGAQGDFLSAGKKLLNVRHPKFKAVTQLRGQATQLWKSKSLPFPEAGIRLIRRDDISLISTQLTSFKAELLEAVQQLDRCFDELKTAARQRLGDLYSDADYPQTLVGLFDLAWDFPSVEPPQYLQRLSPQLYQQECQRMQARFSEAVQLAENAFTEELAKLVEHLAERLRGDEDGKPKVFRDSAVTNLHDFFSRFRQLSISSSEQLDDLVEQAQAVIRGVQPQQLRDSNTLREQVAGQISDVQSALDNLLVDRPRRNIQRRPR